ncbi:hypothetical protein ACYOEI_07045 [Singulisphaera rosea]
MAEHQIRLRGGWQSQPLPLDEASPSLRIALPVDPGRTYPGPARLSRSFGNPHIDPRTERLILRMEDVPGLTAALLNDQEITCPTPGANSIETDVSVLVRERNILILDVHPPSDHLPAGWGQVNLVVAPR